MSGNSRKRTLDALAALDLETLQRLHDRHLSAAPRAEAVRGPEVGLVMVRGRIGGGGAPFNLGEASVTRASVRLPSGELGHAVILGRDPAKAALVAHCDALGQTAEWQRVVDAQIVAPSLAEANERRRKRAEETAATRVEFFTMVRGEDA